MNRGTIPHVCECVHCRSGEDHPDVKAHQVINLLMSRLDEHQRRWFAAYIAVEGEAADSISAVARVTGLDRKTIRRGLVELESGLADRPVGVIRKRTSL